MKSRMKFWYQNNIHSKFFSKAKEIQNLAAVKAAGCFSNINDYAKIIIYIDISCELQNVSFDSQAAISLTKMRKSLYNSSRQVLLKLLNLNKKMDVNVVVLKMGISNTNVQKTALTIFDAYKNYYEVDLDHPQYSFMSVYQACKLEKVKVAKKNFIAGSNLNLHQWTKLEKSWDSLVGSIGKADNENKSKLTKTEGAQEIGKTLKRKHEEITEIEDYDVWAKRTLAKAHAELKTLTT